MLEIKAVCRTTPCKSLWTFGQAMKCFGLRSMAIENLFETEEGTMGNRGFGTMVDECIIDEKISASGITETATERRLREAKASKADDADVPIHLWNERVWRNWENKSECPGWTKSLDVIRECLLRRWKQNLRRSFLGFLREEHGLYWHERCTEEGELSRDLRAASEGTEPRLGQKL